MCLEHLYFLLKKLLIYEDIYYYYTIDKFEKKIVRSEREQEKKKDADRYNKKVCAK